MNDQIKNPRAEGRKSKEGRNSKSESEFAEGALDAKGGASSSSLSSSFWSWGHEQNSATLILREGPLGEKDPPPPLAERTAQFGVAIIRFAKQIPHNTVNERLISQLVGAGTSIGANYCEADDSVSGKEFKLKIGTCRKESKETMFFLRMISSAEPTLSSEARELWREAKELNLIFGAIWRK